MKNILKLAEGRQIVKTRVEISKTKNSLTMDTNNETLINGMDKSSVEV